MQYIMWEVESVAPMTTCAGVEPSVWELLVHPSASVWLPTQFSQDKIIIQLPSVQMVGISIFRKHPHDNDGGGGL